MIDQIELYYFRTWSQWVEKIMKNNSDFCNHSDEVITTDCGSIDTTRWLFWDSNCFFFLDGSPFVRRSWYKILLGGVSFEVVILLFYMRINIFWKFRFIKKICCVARCCDAVKNLICFHFAQLACWANSKQIRFSSTSKQYALKRIFFRNVVAFSEIISPHCVGEEVESKL